VPHRKMNAKQPRITLYSTPGCHHCRQLKQWLQQHQVRFMEMDIQRSGRAFKDFQRHGGRSVPLLLVGEEKIQGFDPKTLPARLHRVGVDYS